MLLMLNVVIDFKQFKDPKTNNLNKYVFFSSQNQSLGRWKNGVSTQGITRFRYSDLAELFPYTGLCLYSRQRYSRKHSTNEISLCERIVQYLIILYFNFCTGCPDPFQRYINTYRSFESSNSRILHLTGSPILDPIEECELR